MGKPTTPKPKLKPKPKAAIAQEWNTDEKKPKAKAKKPKRKPTQPKRPCGRPLWEPTKEERLMVELAVGAGYTHDQIAQLVGKGIHSLERHCRAELDTGALRAGTKVSGALFAKAMKGDVGAIIWWEKTRRGLREVARHEHVGADGGPIEYRDLSEEEVEARIRAHEEAAKHASSPKRA